MGLYGVYDLIENAVTITGHATAVGVERCINILCGYSPL